MLFRSVLTSISLIILGIISAITGDKVVTTALISESYIGYSDTLIGAVIGAVWGFIDGFIGGFLFAWLYNFIKNKRT